MLVNYDESMIMETPILYSFFLTATICLSLSSSALASDEKPVGTIATGGITIAVTDTLPQQQNQKPPETSSEKPEDIIKEVPKSRKQVKPLAVTTTVAVKPVVIKPKIVVKSIIKLH